MPDDPLRSVFKKYLLHLNDIGVSYEPPQMQDGKVMSVRALIPFPTAGARICRLVRVQGYAIFIARVGHYKHRRLKRLEYYLEELTQYRIEVWGRRVKWAVELPPNLMRYTSFASVLADADADIAAVTATLNRLAPHPNKPPLFFVEAPLCIGEDDELVPHMH